MTIAYNDAGGPESTSAPCGGTTPFMAPELLSPTMFQKTRCRVSKEADVYAFGMVILQVSLFPPHLKVSGCVLKYTTQVLTGLVPFHPLREAEICYKVLDGGRPTKPTNASDVGISDGLWQLLARCWNADDTKRPQVNEIFQHLCQEPGRQSIFPPSGNPPAPSYEDTSISATDKHGNSP